MNKTKRNRFKNLKVTPTEATYTPTPMWCTGDDVPLTFKKKEVRKMCKRTIKQNYRIGSIDKATKNMMLANL